MKSNQLDHALRPLGCEPWAVEAAGMTYLRDRLNAGGYSLATAMVVEVQSVTAPMSTRVELRDGVAVVSARGTMFPGPTPLLKTLGVPTINTAQLTTDLRALKTDASVRAVFLAFDSPGGLVRGTESLHDAVADLAQSKPVHVHSAEQLASAGLWAMASATRITAGNMAEIGSAGVLKLQIDSSARAAAQGHTVHAVTTGPHKALGYDGVPVSPAQLAVVKDNVNTAFRPFKEALRSGRRLTDAQLEQTVSGRTWFAEGALAVGLIDAVETRETALDALSREHDEVRELTAKLHDQQRRISALLPG